MTDQTTIRAWVAPPETEVQVRDLRLLQKHFRNRISIVRSNTGGMVVYPDLPGDAAEFDVFMERYTPFVARPVDLRTI